ncbi:MAG: hypothetical protein FJZ57_01125 [Chlamydiae bacterium]|nr:hypothetical protein [Chlamydiota bacterium]
MKFTLAQEHIDHFNKTGAIEFYDLFSEKECQTLLNHADSILTQRVNPTPRNPLHLASNENLYLNGKNLWKDGFETKKLCLKKQLADIAFHLFRKKHIRLAFDQYVRTGTLQDCPFKDNLTIQDISSIRPTIGGVFILLEDYPFSFENPLIPKKAGNVIFAADNVLLPLKELFTEKNVFMLMIGFSSGKPLYCLEMNDPHTHSLKKDGIVFGDSAGEDLCPTLLMN